MKKIVKILLISMICHIALSGIINIQQNPKQLTIKLQNGESKNQLEKNKVEINSSINFRFGENSVAKNLCKQNLHGFAYRQLISLYPKHKNSQLNSCSYTVYGPSRIYTFQLLDDQKIVKLLSSVQNSAQNNVQSTKQTAIQQKKTEIKAQKANTQEKNTKQNQGYKVIKLSRAYEIPRVVLAIKNVIRSNWVQIRSAPLVRCLQKWQSNTYKFKLYFDSINKSFQYTHNSKFQSSEEQIQDGQSKSIVQDKPISNLRIDVEKKDVKAQQTTKQDTKVEKPSEIKKQIVQSKDQQFLSRTEPIFTVKSVNKYNSYSIIDFKNHPGYIKVVQKCNQHFGNFDQKWISKIQYKLDADSKIHYFQLVVNFIPFLVQVDLEAHYYGTTEKASILQIDEKVFNGKNSEKYFDNWTQIKNFTSYKAFRDANQYVLSQFTYLRFYKVTAAYSALYKFGRYVRLVYQSENNYFTFTPKGQNQFNILVHIVDGKYYIDRQDFHATNTYSFGRNDWISLFTKLQNVNTHENYHKIVKYFKSQYFGFSNIHTIQEVRFRDNLYVVKFRNPTNVTIHDLKEKYAIVKINLNNVKVLNHFNWTLLNDKSIEKPKIQAFIKQKYNSSVILFSQFTTTSYGKHFEVSYLNSTNNYSSAYLRFVESQQLFTEDQWQGIAYQINFDEIPLPKNPEQQIIKFVISQDKNIIGVIQIKLTTKNNYNCIALRSGQRWRLNVNWVKGNWTVSSRQVIRDGYYFVTGYPSINIASCTGYLAKIYPSVFNTKWIYSSIQVKNIGYFIYNRIIFKIGNSFFQGVIRSTHGIQNSHSLISWDRVLFVVQKQDYGYGITYSWNYGYNSRYFFDFNSSIYLSPKSQVTFTISQKKNQPTDVLCTYWSNNKCLSCSGDYYAEDGKCVRIQQQCLNWSKNGDCVRCSFGYNVDKKGKCTTQIVVISKAN